MPNPRGNATSERMSAATMSFGKVLKENGRFTGGSGGSLNFSGAGE